MKMNTIAAIATAMSSSGIGIVRISGDEAFTIIDKIYRRKRKKQTENYRRHLPIPFIMDILPMGLRSSMRFWSC